MALYDHRVFKQDQNWWVAQVHGQNSAVTSGPAAQAPMTHDFVFFTSLTLENTNSRVAFVPTGKLNSMSHRSIIRILERAEDFGSRREMEPYNVPDQTGYAGWNQITDEEGLRWVINKNRIQKVPEYLQPFSSMEFVCLDDSALRRNILFQDSNAYDRFAETRGSTGDEQLIKHIKSSFEEVEPEQLTGGWKPPASTETRVREWMRGKGMEVNVTHYDFTREVYAWRLTAQSPPQCRTRPCSARHDDERARWPCPWLLHEGCWWTIGGQATVPSSLLPTKEAARVVEMAVPVTVNKAVGWYERSRGP